MFLRLLLAYLFRRTVGAGGRRRGWPSYGSRRRRSSRFGFFGPFPTYSTRSRGGSRVTVSGCCLPIPLALVLGAVLAARSLPRR